MPGLRLRGLKGPLLRAALVTALGGAAFLLPGRRLSIGLGALSGMAVLGLATAVAALVERHVARRPATFRRELEAGFAIWAITALGAALAFAQGTYTATLVRTGEPSDGLVALQGLARLETATALVFAAVGIGAAFGVTAFARQRDEVLTVGAFLLAQGGVVAMLGAVAALVDESAPRSAVLLCLGIPAYVVLGPIYEVVDLLEGGARPRPKAQAAPPPGAEAPALPAADAPPPAPAPGSG